MVPHYRKEKGAMTINLSRIPRAMNRRFTQVSSLRYATFCTGTVSRRKIMEAWIVRRKLPRLVIPTIWNTAFFLYREGSQCTF